MSEAPSSESNNIAAQEHRKDDNASPATDGKQEKRPFHKYDVQGDEPWLKDKELRKQRNKEIKLQRLEHKRLMVKEKRKVQRTVQKQNRKRLKEELGDAMPKREPVRKMAEEGASAQRIAVDLDFVSYMITKDLKKLCKQLMNTYGANRRGERPLQLYMTSFKEPFTTLLPESPSWDVHKREEDYLHVFGKENVVYLTSESENVITELDESKAYIIGGIVDHNSHKGLTHKLAIEKGISHARLPIDEFVKLSTRRVLTVNHVFMIIQHYVVHHDWQQAFLAVIPSRKGIAPRTEAETTNKHNDNSSIEGEEGNNDDGEDDEVEEDDEDEGEDETHAAAPEEQRS